MGLEVLGFRVSGFGVFYLLMWGWVKHRSAGACGQKHSAELGRGSDKP